MVAGLARNSHEVDGDKRPMVGVSHRKKIPALSLDLMRGALGDNYDRIIAPFVSGEAPITGAISSDQDI